MKYKTIDLFAGIGGIRKGFEMTNFFENVISAEIDKYACQTYQHLYGENPTNDVTNENFKSTLEKIEYDTLLAGFPCQSFSRAGKQEGFLDATRGTLFFHIADIIKRTSPKTFLLENVDNLLSHDNGNTFQIIINVLCNELNYYVIGTNQTMDGNIDFKRENFIRNSKNFGIPQNRPRAYIMGFSKKYYKDKLQLIKNYSLPLSRNKEAIYSDLNDLLEFKADEKYYIASGYLETLKKHKARHKNKGNGFGYIVVNEPNIKEPIANTILAVGGSGKERNLVYDPQEELSGKIIKGKQTPLNDEGIRHMTPREWGKLQGFINYAFIDGSTDTFSFPNGMSDTQKYKQFGNSVTIPVIEEMALFMKKCIDMMK